MAFRMLTHCPESSLGNLDQENAHPGHSVPRDHPGIQSVKREEMWRIRIMGTLYVLLDVTNWIVRQIGAVSVSDEYWCGMTNLNVAVCIGWLCRLGVRELKFILLQINCCLDLEEWTSVENICEVRQWWLDLLFGLRSNPGYRMLLRLFHKIIWCNWKIKGHIIVI